MHKYSRHNNNYLNAHTIDNFILSGIYTIKDFIISIWGKYFSQIRLVWMDQIQQSRRLHIPLPKAALIYINLVRVIDFFQINQNNLCDLILTDHLKLLCSSCFILYYFIQSTYASTYDRSTCTSSFLSSNLLYQCLIRFHNPFYFKQCDIIHVLSNQLNIPLQIPGTNSQTL